MADLFAHLPATEAYAIKNRLARAARAVADREPAGGRTALAPSAAAPSAAAARCRDEIQADVFADLLLAGDSGSAGAAGTGPGGGAGGAEFAGIRASRCGGIFARETGTAGSRGAGFPRIGATSITRSTPHSAARRPRRISRISAASITR